MVENVCVCPQQGVAASFPFFPSLPLLVWSVDVELVQLW
jgi:hypothetical protein